MTDRIAVLVVDDEVLVRLDVADQLRDVGYEVLEASNADQAIEILNITPSIRLLFTDIDMPGSMDGLKLAAAVEIAGRPSKSLSRPVIETWTSLKYRMAAYSSASPTRIWLYCGQCASCSPPD
jgi:CheY-like chemotaxis protein